MSRGDATPGRLLAPGASLVTWLLHEGYFEDACDPLADGLAVDAHPDQVLVYAHARGLDLLVEDLDHVVAMWRHETGARP